MLFRSNNDDYDYDYDYNDNCSRRDDYYDCCDGYYNSCRRQTWSADLKVWNISYSTTTEQLSIRIDNIWKKDITQSFKVKVTVDGETYSYTINERINAGSNKYLKIDVDNLDIRRTGTYNVRAQLDTSNVIKESDKTNNSLTSSVYFNLNDGYNDDDDDNYYDRNVDLYISQIYYDDNDNNMIIRIKNKWGERVTKTFKMKIEVNSHTYYFYVNEAIGSNDYIDYEISIDKLDVREWKTYTVKVRLDINNNISERSESNNYYSESVDFED